MDLRVTFWTRAAGGVAWGDIKDGLLLIPVFDSENSFNVFDKKFKETSSPQLIITVVEYHNHYDLVFYEDPKDKLIPEFGFIISEMNLDGYYSKFKKDFKLNSKMYFSYSYKHRESKSMKSRKEKIKLLNEPFLIKEFRIIKESDLEIDEIKKLMSSNTGLSIYNFRYYNEAIGLLNVRNA